MSGVSRARTSSPARRRSRGRSHRSVLHLDEFDACPLRLVAVERRGKNLGVGIAVFDHAISRLLQRVQSFTHELLALLLPRAAMPANRRPTLRHDKPRSCEIKSAFARS